MRDFAKIRPQFWMRGTGKALRGNKAAQVLAVYLMSCCHANAVGLYWLSILNMCNETGLNEHEAKQAIADLEEAGFAVYDEDAEAVWVINMAREQLDKSMKKNDPRKGIVRRAINQLGEDCPLVRAFLSKYGEAFGFGPTNELPPSSNELPPPVSSSDAKGEPHEVTTTSPSDYDQCDLLPVTTSMPGGDGDGDGDGDGERDHSSEDSPELNQPKPSRKRPKNHPNPKDIPAWCRSKDLDPGDPDVLAMVDWHLANGVGRSDWPATLRNWKRKRDSFKQENRAYDSSSAQQPANSRPSLAMMPTEPPKVTL